MSCSVNNTKSAQETAWLSGSRDKLPKVKELEPPMQGYKRFQV